jgi:D-sedoheptulose 7-phosphate isomerase
MVITDKFKDISANFAILAVDAQLGAKIETCAEWMIGALHNGKKIMLCGNGGSAADAQHISGEFLCRFYKDRRPLPAIALTTDSSTITAIGNDYSYDQVFSRQVEALGNPGDILVGISTSGSSKNILRAFEVAGIKQIKRVLLTGAVERDIARVSDLVLALPSKDTPRVQEMMLAVEHVLCEIVEGAV